ncbi:MAG: phosphoglycerate dehydrogenase [Thermodesulfobacteriota bacterium]|nr:phosphoglycerate dehydrogenase [Thermodesulfobacteriota bacterium]
MKVLISDKLGDAGIEIFENEPDIEVTVNTDLTPEELLEEIEEFDALVIRSATKVTAELLDAAKNIKVVGRAGIGLDNVDIPAATQKGVVVMNTPTGNTVTTAEHAIAMMMSLSRNIPRGTESLRNGRWDKKKLQGRELMNKTLGVLGFGKIGSIVADRARGLKMNVIVFDPNVNPERIEKAGYKSVTLDELFEQADYITIHVPKIKKTTGLINKDAFAKMKDGVMLVNCARGGIVDEDDLCEALKSGKVAGAALDVFATEPPGESPLFAFDNFICTPHLGASTKEAQRNVAVDVANQIIAYLKNGTVINAVNAPSVTGEKLQKLKPYLELAERMGRLQAQIIEGKLKEVAIEYNGDYHGLDLNPVSTALLNGLLDPLLKDAVNAVNAPAIAQEMGIKVSETSSAEPFDYRNLMTVKITTTEGTETVAGTIFGKIYPRIVRINDFRMDLSPYGHILLILSANKPGDIGNIGAVLGEEGINVLRLMIGQEEEIGEKNLIVVRTEDPVPPEVITKIEDQDLIKSVWQVEFQ